MEEKITIEPKLRKFLEKEGVLERFIKNTYNDKILRVGLDIYDVHSIMAAFCWKYTSEGYDFWRNLDVKWVSQQWERRNGK